MNFIEVINKLKTTSSRNEKIQILKENYSPELDKILFYTYNTFMNYKVNKLPSPTKKLDVTLLTFFKTLKDFNDKEGITNKEKQLLSDIVNSFDDETKQILKDVIGRNLKIGVNTQTINKLNEYTPIPEFKCMLAESENKLDKFMKENTDAFINYKYDGVRAIIKIIGSNVTIYSRSGKIYNIPIIEDKIRKCNLPTMTLDSEITTKDGDFEKLMTVIRKKKLTQKDKKILNECVVNVFDCINYELNDISQKPIKSRLSILKENIKETKNIKLVKYKYIENINKNIVNKLLIEAVNNGYEGIILKSTKHKYVNKRNISWVKVKKKHDTIDCKIIGVKEGVGKYKGMLGAFEVEYNNKIFDVGTGFSDKQRVDYFKNKNELIDKTVEVDFMEFTKDEKPRFPVFKCIREDKVL